MFWHNSVTQDCDNMPVPRGWGITGAGSDWVLREFYFVMSTGWRNEKWPGLGPVNNMLRWAKLNSVIFHQMYKLTLNNSKNIFRDSKKIFWIHLVLIFKDCPETKVQFCSPVFDLLWSRPHYLIFAQASPAKLNVKIFHHMHPKHTQSWSYQ